MAVTDEPARLHSSSTVVDCHNDVALLIARHHSLGDSLYFRDIWLPQAGTGGLDVQVVAISLEPEYLPEGALRRSLLLIEHIYREAENYAGVAICRSGRELDEALRARRLALIIALEGSQAIGTDLELIRTFHRLGVRVASLSWFNRTMLADGSAEEFAGSRLPKAGVEAVRKMEDVGILVDISHLALGGVQHVLEIATRPVIASHSGVRSVFDHHRNLRDDHVCSLAATGGVIGVPLIPALIDPSKPTLNRVVDHIEHITQLAGIDHVGIGSDLIRDYYEEKYPGVQLMVHGVDFKATLQGLSGPGDLPALTGALLSRGLSEDDVRKVLGLNFLRVFRQALEPATNGK